jgi:ATP-dependent RNA helicase HelY
MFDAATSRLIRQAPPLRGVDPEVLPQELTGFYAELIALRLREDQLEAAGERAQLLERLSRVATIYEACADTGQDADQRQASAFVAATAHQILGKVLSGVYDRAAPYLTATAVHPLLAAPLLFLVAEQNADAREAARPLSNARDENLIKSALIETVHDLASEDYQAILQRAERLSQLRASPNDFSDTVIEQALYGLCWSGIVQLVCQVLNVERPRSQFLQFETPQQAFETVIELSVENLEFPGEEGAGSYAVFGGPRHLASLLLHLSDSLDGAGVANIPPPAGSGPEFWTAWLSHRARSKPVLWLNHRRAIETEFLDIGNSAVLVLPTGAGKTTLSELKIASTLSANRKVVFLVPTLALVDQLRDELAESFPATIGNIHVSADGDLTGALSMPQLSSVEVMTPERCLALMSHNADALQDVGLVVFDECHLLSPQGGGKRSLDAMLCLLQACRRAPDADFLLLSAMLTNADDFAGWIAEITQRPCSAFQDSWKPSRQARGVVLYAAEEIAEIRRSARIPARRGARIRRKKDAVPYALFGLHQNWNARAATDIRLIKLSDHTVDLSASRAGAVKPNANKVAARLAVDAAVAGIKTIVFVQQPSHAVSTARLVSEDLESQYPFSAIETALWDDIQAELGGAQYSFIQPGVAALPHNGDMIPLERRLVESLYRKSTGASVIVATPTLAQGMNLPAQLAILAGDRRHDDDGRAQLGAHEILNAAGRAGRAGHLANGLVLMIPEPVVSFDAQERPDAAALLKLRNILPEDDRCVTIVDPITLVLDRIQAGDLNSLDVRYFVSRIQAAEDPGQAAENALAVVRRSFSHYLAVRQNAEQDFENKVAALQQVIANGAAENVDVHAIAASHGLTADPLTAAKARIEADFQNLPTTIGGWMEWLIDFLDADRESYEALMDTDAPNALGIMRGTKQGGPPTAAEFQRLKGALLLWMRGRPYSDIETHLGATPATIKCCPRARDLVLKLANRRLYLIASAIGEIARQLYEERETAPPQPSVLETLSVAVRKGLDTPQKIAYDQLSSTRRSRARIHSSFAQDVPNPADLRGHTYEVVLNEMRARLLFSGFSVITLDE